MTPLRSAVLLIILCGLLLSPHAAAHVVGTQPLDSPEFHNRWPESDEPAWRAVVDLYYAGRLEETAERLRTLLREGHDERLVRQHLAIVYKDLGDPGRAAGEYGRLAALAPDDPHIRLDWAFATLAAKDAETARRLFAETLALDDHEAWAHLGLGLTLLALQETEGALRSLVRAIVIDDRLALAFEILGELYQAQGQHYPALAALRQAVRLDPSYVTVYPRLGRSAAAVGDVTEAWRHYERAARIFPSDARVQREVARFVEEHRDVVLRLEEADRDRRQRTAHTRVKPLEAADDTPVIRVGLLEGAGSLSFSAGAPFRVVALGETQAAPGRATPTGDAALADPLEPVVWTVRRQNGVLSLEGPRLQGPELQGSEPEFSELQAPEGRKISLAPQVATRGFKMELLDPAATFVVLDLEAGRGYFWARKEDRQVRGDLLVLVRDEGLTLVNELDLESYLIAVVPSEMYAEMNMEALQAQAMAARTYALRSLGRYARRGFDVLGSVASAEYRGVDREHPRTTEAVLATRGQVLTHRGRLIEALYHSSSGGYTAASKDVWGGDHAYLATVPEWGAEEVGAPRFPLGPGALESWLKHMPDVYSSRSEFGLNSTFRWVRQVSAEEVRARVNRVAPVGRIARLVPGARSVSGYLSSVTVVGTDGTYEVRGDRIRSLLGGLKSNAFKIETFLGGDGLPETFWFFGAGFGHGVGLSQLGAAGMAEAGASALDIVAHYYPGARITPDYNRTR